MSIIARAPDIALQPGESHVIDGHVPERLPDGRYTLVVATAPGVAGLPFDVSVCLGPTTSAGAQIQLGATSVPAGGTLPYKLLNGGTGCLGTGVGFTLEHQEADGTFTRVTLPYMFIAIGLMIPPRGSRDFSATIPADAPAGTYRITHEGSSATFEVTLP